MVMWQFWLIVAGIFFIGEIFTAGFLVFWVGVGAVFAMISSFFTDNIIIQTTIFVLLSGILLFFTRPFVRKYVDKDQDNVVTNAMSVVGKKGVVTEEIDTVKSVGLVKVGEEVWSATTETQDVIPKGTKVEVKDINGVKLVVTPIVSAQAVEKTAK